MLGSTFGNIHIALVRCIPFHYRGGRIAGKHMVCILTTCIYYSTTELRNSSTSHKDSEVSVLHECVCALFPLQCSLWAKEQLHRSYSSAMKEHLLVLALLLLAKCQTSFGPRLLL